MSMLLLADPTNPECVVVERSPKRTRFRSQLHTRELDQALAAGVSPDASAALSLRAHRLIGPTARSALARSIWTLIDDAEHPLGPLYAVVPICRRKVWRARKALEELADRLESADPVDACGAAKVHLLLNDSSGPVYDRPAADDLEPAIRQARLALEMTV